MFSRMVVSNRKLAWNTTPTWLRSESTVACRMSTPSNVMEPDSGSYSRMSNEMSVDLPDPDGPTNATREPAVMTADTESSTWRSLVYEKLTSLMRISCVSG